MDSIANYGTLYTNLRLFINDKLDVRKCSNNAPLHWDLDLFVSHESRLSNNPGKYSSWVVQKRGAAQVSTNLGAMQEESWVSGQKFLRMVAKFTK